MKDLPEILVWVSCGFFCTIVGFSCFAGGVTTFISILVGSLGLNFNTGYIHYPLVIVAVVVIIAFQKKINREVQGLVGAGRFARAAFAVTALLTLLVMNLWYALSGELSESTTTIYMAVFRTGSLGDDKDKKDEKKASLTINEVMEKQTVKEVMRKAHAEGALLEKVVEGTATANEKKQLVKLYVDLHNNTPPNGDHAKWAKVTQMLVDAARAVEDAKDESAQNARSSLAKQVNCKSCHDEFRPKKKQKQ